jgi:hypothetical protein
MPLSFECHYCQDVFRDFTGLVSHFEREHRNKDEYIVKEFPAGTGKGGMPIIKES